MQTTTALTTPATFGVFEMDRADAEGAGPPGLDEIERFYRDFGYVLLRGLIPDELTDRMETECAAAQADVLSGRLSERYGSTKYLDAAEKIEKFVNYVEHIQELSPAVLAAATHPALVAVIRRLVGDGAWLNGSAQAGVVYQDSRPGRESGYTRIGWHSDWQAMPSVDIWPGVAFTFHLDGTSPANGFLRVVPGSQAWATPAPYRNVNNVAVPDDARPAGGYTPNPPPFEMPLGFEKIRGEVPVYTERGDVILHDAYLWHAAARATVDDGIRRHVRGNYLGGPEANYRPQFLKNAAR
ncbi:phytanoyl-CoA dioxygenase family protein [Frankia sp. CNm7]|uniref:Phytanoyl-CoA dioxygenase family protein n=1 Tax=Frankia nepalensis TaxID=1836974 RepID=A0A937RI47_9ACTN|nr:phytanoyl-CoA dioxygenase family protein [Frankia nepalensis]MBL7495494.1 phytanoyl-CoA dioxygenase family protein [Frankia nepalensis]MBL7510862.1 phytanoyl-CoA dioxygenase family protein [Frankia nepalensis]MBL7520396.1 phytanoyl-CoA dioxygenase family protein [Frankia nepalensis]MBL7630597.1 phytanoyl-CoA dioxygenase family protein [Frankia nepalensis]